MNGLPALYIDRSLPDGCEDLFAGRARIVGPEPEALAAADGVVAGAARWDGARMDAASERLRVISRSGSAYDGADLAAATERGLVVCNAPEAPTVSTAEHAVTLMLAAAKRIAVSQGLLRGGAGDYFAANAGMELEGRTLGLVAYGRISRRVGKVAQALGMDVVACDPYLTDAAVELVDFETLLARADVISVHAPLTADTHHMFAESAFALVKPGLIFVNTARGGLVDQDALLAALDDGRVLAAGLDVTDPEPLPPHHALLTRDDVIVTPHIASATATGKRRLYDHAIGNALMVIAGERPTTVVNPEVYP
ncbi:MAG: NAD(P)-dependent oxidoreductase [Acidimicrobiales bacterium]